MTHRRGLLIILSSPSGAGKSTLARRLQAWDSQMLFSVSATTRPARPGEVDGSDYHFLSRTAFEQMVADGEMLEHAEVFGNLYGSPRGPVLDAIKNGLDVIFDVDWQGGDQLRASDLHDDVLSVFILPPSIAALEQRLVSRGQDSAEVVARRMAQSRDEISHWKSYEYVLVNDDLDRCFDQLRSIVLAARLRRAAQPALAGKVAALNAEFEDLT